MAQIRGKFITLACSLLQTKPEAKAAALQKVKDMTGLDPSELKPEEWYEAAVIGAVFNAIEEKSSRILARAAIQLIGENVFPTIKKTVGMPAHLKTPLDFIKHEKDTFVNDHRGPDVKPRVIKEAADGRVVMEALSPGYNCSFIEGVYMGILKMCNAKDPQVQQIKCVTKGDPICEYLITWKP